MEEIIVGNFICLENTLSIHSKIRNESYYKIYKKDTHEYVGNCGIRFNESEEIEYFGNIEYEIFEPYRGNGYAKEATLLLGNLAYDWGIKSLTITANIKNTASLHLIEHLGAKFIQVKKVPKNCRLYQQGDRLLSIYNWKIEKRNLL